MKKLIPIIVLFFSVSVFAQEKPKAVLVDEFGMVSCEDLYARIDSFQIQLSNNPDKIGFVIFKRGQNPTNKVRWYKKFPCPLRWWMRPCFSPHLAVIAGP